MLREVMWVHRATGWGWCSAAGKGKVIVVRYADDIVMGFELRCRLRIRLIGSFQCGHECVAFSRAGNLNLRFSQWNSAY